MESSPMDVTAPEESPLRGAVLPSKANVPTIN